MCGNQLSPVAVSTIAPKDSHEGKSCINPNKYTGRNLNLIFEINDFLQTASRSK